MTPLLLPLVLQINADPPRTIALTWPAEPRERAFAVLMPRGWQSDGGSFRLDPSRAGGPAKVIVAKGDFTIRPGRAGPGRGGCGSMTAGPLPRAEAFLVETVFPQTHPHRAHVRVRRGGGDAELR